MEVVAIITAAGSSKRMGTGEKKEYILLGGKHVLAWTIDAFLSITSVKRIVVTIPKGDRDKVIRILKLEDTISNTSENRITLTEGGETRQDSIFNALTYINNKTYDKSPDIVLIHDGARPWIDSQTIYRVLKGSEIFGACVPVVEIPDAVKKVGKSGFIINHPVKGMYVAAQTPQGFKFKEIFYAHRRAREIGYHTGVDDAQLYSMFVHPVFTVKGNLKNRKITYSEDLNI